MMSTKTDKQDLFGAVNQRQRTQGGVLSDEDIEILSTPLSDDSVINVLCTKHFPVFPINEQGRVDLLESSGQAEPSDWTGKYFEVSGCPFCTSYGRFENPVLKDFRSS